jgi:hypothetical protein
VQPGSALNDCGPIFCQKTGRVFELIDTDIVENAVRKAGFVDVVVKKMKMPMPGWPTDDRLHKICVMNHLATEAGLEGNAMFMLTQVLGWSAGQVQVFIAMLRRELRRKRIHPYVWTQVVHGRKPVAARRNGTNGRRQSGAAWKLGREQSSRL